MRNVGWLGLALLGGCANDAGSGGDTAVIGGIYSTRDGRSWQKVPWFAELPVIGWLFKTKRDTSDREEMLIFLTPRIVNRAESIGR